MVNEGCPGKNAVREEKTAEGWVPRCEWFSLLKRYHTLSTPFQPTYWLWIIVPCTSCPCPIANNELPVIQNRSIWGQHPTVWLQIHAILWTKSHRTNLQFKLSFSTTIRSLHFLRQNIEKNKHLVCSDVQDLQCHKTRTGSDHCFFWFKTLSRRHSTSCCTGRYKKPLQMQLSNHLPTRKLSPWHPLVKG